MEPLKLYIEIQDEETRQWQTVGEEEQAWAWDTEPFLFFFTRRVKRMLEPAEVVIDRAVEQGREWFFSGHYDNVRVTRLVVGIDHCYRRNVWINGIG